MDGSLQTGGPPSEEGEAEAFGKFSFASRRFMIPYTSDGPGENLQTIQHEGGIHQTELVD